MKPLVYFVRHGETAWNAEMRLQGQADTVITELGRSQADRNGSLLARLIPTPEDFDFVASPMRRTRETMERIRRAMELDPHGYRTDPRLVEVHFGDWQGYTFAELEKADSGSSERRGRDKWNFVPPGQGAESYQMLLERVRPWFDAIDRQTVCVTHGGVLRTVLRMMDAMSETEASLADIPQDRLLRLHDGRLEWL